MEALVILLAEFLLAPIIVCVAVVGNVFAAFVVFIIQAFFWMFGMHSISEDTRPIASHKSIGSLKWVKRTALILLAIIVSALLTVNFVFFEPTAKWLVANVAQKTGIELYVGKISGNIFTGAVNFIDLKINRVSDEKSNFDLTVKKASIDINIWSLVFRPITLETIVVENVEGKIKQPETKPKSPRSSADSTQKIKNKRTFIVEDLKLSDIDVALSKGNNTPIAVYLQEVTSAPFRSNYAIFDVFFRSNVSGSINGHEIRVSTEVIESGRVTKWDIDELPVATVSSFVTKPPIGWFKNGTIDIEVEDKWQLDQKADIEMDWRFRMQDVRVRVPSNAGLVERTLATPIASYINAKDEGIDLKFSLIMNEEQFENASSLDASGIWDALVKSMASAIGAHTGNKTEDVKQGIGNAAKGFKGFLDKKRK